jgi:uncharacterized coiled-coil protein SlyX
MATLGTGGTSAVEPGETINEPVHDETPEVVLPEGGEPAVVVDDETTTDEVDRSIRKLQRRIDKRTADVYRERAEKEALRQRLTELEARVSGQEAPAPETNIDVLVEHKSKIKDFARTANQLVDEGNKSHKDYMSALKDLASEVGDFVRRDGTPSPFMEVVLEASDKPTELLYYLGKNPDLAAELVDLNPIRLAKKLDRIERDMVESSKSATSKAPKPLDAVKPRSSGGPDPSGSYEDFLAWRKTNKGSWR